ncbi:MAG: tRNA dihydrouridine(20/20a) synthase DusA [Pseudomonadales bacterium]|nr:tRNA dihydrouridine(20/20a) synthase DusA [Pseudomonadales bacterium]
MQHPTPSTAVSSPDLDAARRLCVAPMMAWTDRHCRYLHRLAAPRALLFTEMITANALLHGPAERLLRFDPEEHPVAIQLGGSDPNDLARAARLAEQAGYDEINLNVGCPSPRVREGRFGACLMLEPGLVRDCIGAMAAAVRVPVTIKCRLGVDAADSDELLDRFIETTAAGGCRVYYIHARKALLAGLTPAQNRAVPPLQYDRAYRLRARFPALRFIVNGGVEDCAAVARHLEHVDGVMIGRTAYHNPGRLAAMHTAVYGGHPVDSWSLMRAYLGYVERELALGTPLNDMTRHALGVFAGLPGARRYRRMLSDSTRLRANDPALLEDALACLDRAVA